ncbi:MAG: tyrosine--tRNA ligase [Elusimicrobia bacterium RIFCSPLOWO2_01_FULL_60_11]|nr:MAG: tyrosine--tRNA ligase [Elusimicrobia bacterium RIFCSPLOWO2_01_FULL_60_11]
MSAVPEALLRNTAEVISESELSEKLKKGKPLRVKLGVDPTAPDLHLGHTVVLNQLKRFQDAGHKVVFIIGDFTARVGDPSGRNETRPQVSGVDIDKNAKTYLDQVSKVLDIGKMEVRKNSEWLEKAFGVAQIANEGSVFSTLLTRFTVQQLMQREDFSQRLKAGSPITFMEMLYPLFQGYDSVAVKADVELGGTDQLFNLLIGRQIQKDFGQDPQVVITLPLLVGLDGTKKMSKSYGNHIALNDAPSEMFGKLMSVPDDLMWQYFELLTSEDVKAVKQLHPKEAKMRLGRLLTARYHGEEAAQKAREQFDNVFAKGSMPDHIEEHKASQNKIYLSSLLFEAGLSPSKKESKRLIDGGGVKLDGQAVTKDREIELSAPVVLQVGKRKFKKILSTS